ncbi:NAD(P)H-dependent oxidoreductase [Geomonas azotofigens]|uniref:NAD(P)H-dependent oxidoreductase n=1 Tax=Geomonas azotofigens TaxID=2843196 RepID=UPI001C121D93|nr:NAD(P)H-dependent oxidoreductase [Geomonas azotofigens]MBU5613912.1 NAD(P)H-dependent oxidoreductase [Geomonas azotofigens]
MLILMSILLYITCDLRQQEQSCCLTAGLAFLDAYQKANPRDEIHMLDLYRDPLQPADLDVLSAWDKTARGHHFATLTKAEQQKMVRISTLAMQFAAADKYVFVTPMWKPGFPPQMLEYLDTVLVAGTTYRNTSSGPEGLLKDQERKCLMIHSTEGFVYRKKELHCVSSIRQTMKFLGVAEFSSILIYGVGPASDENAALIRKELGRVAEAALTF